MLCQEVANAAISYQLQDEFWSLRDHAVSEQKTFSYEGLLDDRVSVMKSMHVLFLGCHPTLLPFRVNCVLNNKPPNSF